MGRGGWEKKDEEKGGRGVGREREEGEKNEGKRMTWRVKEGKRSLRLKRWRGGKGGEGR